MVRVTLCLLLVHVDRARLWYEYVCIETQYSVELLYTNPSFLFVRACVCVCM